jgi:hypothetical protein
MVHGGYGGVAPSMAPASAAPLGDGSARGEREEPGQRDIAPGA